MKNILTRSLSALIWVYFTLLFAWLLLYYFTGDRLGLISLVNILAVYLFLPLPLALLANLRLQRRGLWIAGALALFAFAWLWGGLFVPRPQRALANPPDGGTLKVMTYNVLGRQSFTAPQIDTIRKEDADLVLIQELNSDLAAAIRDELASQYPYQVLVPQRDVHGMGVLSKYPLRPLDEKLPLKWVGVPQVLAMDWNGTVVTVINFHMTPTTLETLDIVSAQNRDREEQARALVDLARRSGPVILGGDANMTPLSDAYAILTSELRDAWLQTGFGLGHTFPGSDHQEGSRPRIAGVPVPMWLARIDYILYSPDWKAASVHNTRFDGASDHRGVVAVLKWEGDQ